MASEVWMRIHSVLNAKATANSPAQQLCTYTFARGVRGEERGHVQTNYYSPILTMKKESREVNGGACAQSWLDHTLAME